MNVKKIWYLKERYEKVLSRWVNSRVYEYRVGLQFRREGFINPAACLFEAHFEMIISSLEKCTLRGKMSSEKCNFLYHTINPLLS